MASMKLEKCPGKKFSGLLIELENDESALAELKEHSRGCSECLDEYFRIENLYAENSKDDRYDFDKRHFNFMEVDKTSDTKYSTDIGVGRTERCPGGRLKVLLTHLEIEAFEKLKIEPTTEGARCMAEFDGNFNPTPYDLDNYYCVLLMFYRGRQEIGKEIYSYGDNRDEILKNLSRHVDFCFECSERYRDFIDVKFRSAKRIMKERKPKFFSQMNFDAWTQLRWRIDEKYLKRFVRD